MKEKVPNGHKENQIRHFENQKILTGRHHGKFMERGQKRKSPEELAESALKPDLESVVWQRQKIEDSIA